MTDLQKERRRSVRIAYWKRYWPFYLFLLPAVLDVLVFRYFPMYGIQIAFRDYKIRKGI